MKAIRYLFMAMVMTMILGSFAVGQSVTVDYDHNANFESYHSYYWLKVKTTNPLWEQRIKDAVDQELQKKGWQRSDTGGDVALTAVGSANTQTEYTTFYDNLGGGWYWGGFGTATTTPVTYEVGTLVLDMYDAQTKRLVWRAVATKTLSKKPENEKALQKTVEKMFKNFPPKK